MTLREFYLQRRQAELPAFLRVLNALPKDRLNYRPDQRSPSAEEIAWKLTTELKSCLDVVVQQKTEWNTEPPPPLEEMVRLFELWSNQLVERVAKMDDQSWEQMAHFYYKGKLASEQPVSAFLWYILFDGIHHRGQLSAYLRPMGGKVPSVYGPSADEKGAR